MLFYVLFIFYAAGVVRTAMYLIKHSGNQSLLYYFFMIVCVWLLALWFCVCTAIQIICAVLEALMKAFTFPDKGQK